MANNVVTSQPAFNSHETNAISDQPPSYEEVISQQPKPSNINLIVNDNEDTTILTPQTDHATAAQLNSEQEDKCENCEEQQRRNNRRYSDCCFVCYVDNDPGWWICCKLFSDCCICLADCTESCCENCANCLQSCCESNTVEEAATNDDCCGDCCGDCFGSDHSFLCGCHCDCSDYNS